MKDFLINISYYIHFLTEWPIILGVCLATGLFLIAKKKFNQLKIFSIALILTSILTLLIKDLTKINRPINALIGLDDYAFPSGHASISFFFLTFLSNYIWKSDHKKVAKILSISLIGLIAVMVIGSRLILEVHTTTQIVAGAILGLVITLWAIKKFEK